MQPESNEPESSDLESPELTRPEDGVGAPEDRRFSLEVRSTQSNDSIEVRIRMRFPWLGLARSNLGQFAKAFQWAGGGVSLPRIRVPSPALLVISILLAISGQYLISIQNIPQGSRAYLASAAGLAIWAIRNRKWSDHFATQIHIPAHVEKILLALLILATAFTRFYDFKHRLYLLESDSSKWTAESWYSTILHTDYGEFHDLHYKYLPVDFWVRSIFLRLFGVNYTSAQIESAVISVIAVFFLYLFVRRLLNNPAVAYLAAGLYSFSFVELSASHQALHSTPLALWLMPGLYFLTSAIQSKQIWRFQMTGIMMALGMLTYDTFFPTVGFAVIYAASQGVFEIIKKKEAVHAWLSYLGVMLWPIALAYLFFTQDYVILRYSSYYNERLSGLSKTGLFDSLGSIIYRIQSTWLAIFSMISADQFIEWKGPFINPMLLPMVMIGMMYSLWNIRRWKHSFLLVLFFFQIMPAPILLNTPQPRVLYTSLASLMIWGALGLLTSLAALRAILGKNILRVLAGPAFLLILASIFATDYDIFTTRLPISEEVTLRRELADFTSASAERTDMILYPYLPNQNDPVESESTVILFSVGGARRIGLEARQNYRQIHFSQLLPTLWEMRTLPGLDIIFHKNAAFNQEDRVVYLQSALACYPQAALTGSGQFFDVYHIPGQILAQPRCYTPSAPGGIEPQPGARLPAGQSTTFTWDTAGIPFKSYEISLERMIPALHWIEIEQHLQGAGWMVDSGFADGYSGEGFLLDSWEAGEAGYSYSLPQEGQYYAWLRYYKRLENDQQNFISLAGQRQSFGENGTPLNTWNWIYLGAYPLQRGALPIGITRSYNQDNQYSIFVDTLVLTTALEFNPNTDTIWQEKFLSGEIPSTASQYTITNPLPAGEYRWKVRVFDGDQLVDALGLRGVESEYYTFTISP